ncbi:MAG TPA: rhodanese-like domain-containing protein [Burkholderiales bacterium]|nr:rhodanese-like domain-containing protein [Burkholderiales bacterium]
MNTTLNIAEDAAGERLQSITPQVLRRMLDDGEEIVVLDVREEGVFARDGHLLLAANLPLSQLELHASALLPRRSVRTVVCDGNDGLAALAAARLSRYGYTDVTVLRGGAPGWADAGYRLYSGVHVPSKAFGEYVQHRYETPEVTPQTLAAWKADGRRLVILDSRPLEEYRRNTIPGSVDCPGAELPYRVFGLVPSADTTVVVNCGGRTRAIIGAQSLINAGLNNPVFALKDGTQGWRLAGFELATGATQVAPRAAAGALAEARHAAERVARRFDVRSIDRPELETLRDAARTLYLVDVRGPDEFAAGHLPGSISAPGGQLVQATDRYLGVRRARVVLVDDDGVRATMTAAWLVQLGWRDVFVLREAFAGQTLETGPARHEVLGLGASRAATVGANELKALLDRGEAAVADLDTSLAYREGHIPGAWHVVRSRFAENLRALPCDKRLVLTSRDGVLARVAAGDAARAAARDVAVLDGGTSAWIAAGFPLESGTDRMTGPADDIRYRALEQTANVEGAIREYLEWEVNLLRAVKSDPDFSFRKFA